MKFLKGLKNILVFILILVLFLGLISFGIVAYGTATRPVAHMDTINKYSEEYGVDPLLVLSVIKVESNFRPEAKSHKNAHGLMQVIPETGKAIAKSLKKEYSDEMLKDPDTNIQMGTYYLAYLINHFNDEDLAIAAYNGGMGNVEKWLLDKNVSNDGKNLHNIPIDETRNYVKKVRNNYEIYKMFYEGKEPLKDNINKSPKTWVDNYIRTIKTGIKKF